MGPGADRELGGEDLGNLIHEEEQQVLNEIKRIFKARGVPEKRMEARKHSSKGGAGQAIKRTGREKGVCLKMSFLYEIIICVPEWTWLPSEAECPPAQGFPQEVNVHRIGRGQHTQNTKAEHYFPNGENVST